MSAVQTVAINGRLVSAVLVTAPAEHRLRVAADDWEAIGLGRGSPLTVEAPGQPTLAAFVRSVTPMMHTGLVWVLLDAQVRGGPPVKPRTVGGRDTCSTKSRCGGWR